MHSKPEQKTNQINLLFVEDSKAVQHTLNEWINEEIPDAINNFVNTCGDALNALYKKVPDIIILELSFRDGSGIDLLRTIRKQFPQIKTIVFTNTSDDSYRKICSQLGVNYFLDKTFDFGKLAQCINSLFQQPIPEKLPAL